MSVVKYRPSDDGANFPSVLLSGSLVAFVCWQGIVDCSFEQAILRT